MMRRPAAAAGLVHNTKARNTTIGGCGGGCQVRHSSGGRRPTHSEISESLAILGLANIEYDEKAMKKIYFALVKKNHPDAGGDEGTMARIAVAYERLAGLSKREKEEYRAHSSAFSGRTRSSGGGGGGNPYRDHRYAHQNQQRRDGYQQHTQTGFGSQYYQQDGGFPGGGGGGGSSDGSSYWNTHHRMQQERQQKGQGQSFAENPFSSKNPYSFYAHSMRLRNMSAGSVFIQGLVLYLVLSTVFLFLYRGFRDYRNEDGWKMSESLARHEQMQELHRMRQESHERMQLQRDIQANQSGGNVGHAFFYDSRPQGEMQNLRVGETAEQRALEYARQRRMQILEEQRRMGTTAATGGKESSSNLLSADTDLSHLPEMKGWPRISENEGRIIKRAQDPPGVVFYEPRKEDARARQIFNRRKVSEKQQAELAAAASADRAQQQWAQQQQSSSASTAAARNSSGGDDRGGRPMGVPVMRPQTASSQQQPMPESDVGSVFASAVNSNADAKAAMTSIFGAMKEAQTRGSA